MSTTLPTYRQRKGRREFLGSVLAIPICRLLTSPGIHPSKSRPVVCGLDLATVDDRVVVVISVDAGGEKIEILDDITEQVTQPTIERFLHGHGLHGNKSGEPVGLLSSYKYFDKF